MTAPTLSQILRAPGFRAGLVAIVVWGAAFSPAVAQTPVQGDESRAGTPSSADSSASDTPRAVHVRGVNPRTAALLEQDAARSATFKRLLDTVEQSDLVVHVDTGYAKIPSRLGIAAATPAGRFLRIALTVPEIDDRLIAWLAHELQHAVEVAGAPEVVSPATLAQFYERHGERAASEGNCTPKAQKVTSVVLAEVGASQSGRK